MKYIFMIICLLLTLSLSACRNGASNLESKDGSFKGNLEIKDDLGNVIVTTYELESISMVEDSNNEYAVKIILTESGAEKFIEVTTNNIGKFLYIYVDGVCVSSSMVQATITDGNVTITGFDTSLDAYKIVNSVKYGNTYTVDSTEYTTETDKQLSTQSTNTLVEMTESETEQVTHREGMYGVSNKKVSDIDGKFSCSDVRNDVTGNWRVSTIAANVQMVDYALNYYEKYFKNDNQIHCIVNFNYNTTTKITTDGYILYVTVYDYINGEEHDARKMFTGTVLAEYMIYTDNGDVEKIQ